MRTCVRKILWNFSGINHICLHKFQKDTPIHEPEEEVKIQQENKGLGRCTEPMQKYTDFELFPQTTAAGSPPLA